MQAIIAVEMLYPVMSFCDGADCDYAAFSDVWSASITLLFAWEDVGIVHTEARHGMGWSMVDFFLRWLLQRFHLQLKVGM